LGKDGNGFCGFSSEEMFSCAGKLSVRLASRHFDRIELVTDTPGANYAERLGIPFDSVSTDLDRISDISPKLWCYGKMEAYRLQEEPFAHLDFDIFIKRRIDFDRLFPDKSAAFFMWEHADLYKGLYARAVRSCEALRCPRPPRWGAPSAAANAGIVVGLDLDRIRQWCEVAREWVEHPGNGGFWAEALKGGTFKYCIAMEQYLPVQVLGEEMVGVLTCDGRSCRELGIVHYLADLKRQPEIEAKIRHHFEVPRDYPPPPDASTGSFCGDLDE
jgi:hypothetical protein